LFSRDETSSKEHQKQKDLTPVYVCPLNQELSDDGHIRSDETPEHTRVENARNRTAGTGVNAL
jgi:hypothetical protein